MRSLRGPDFPTGGIIVGRDGIREAYRSGRGRIVVRARAHVEELRGGRTAIVVTELPYGVKKGGDNGVIRKIADLVQDKVLTEISDLADHSDKSGMRIQIELKRDARSEEHTSELQSRRYLHSFPTRRSSDLAHTSKSCVAVGRRSSSRSCRTASRRAATTA